MVFLIPGLAVPPHLNGDGFGIGWFCPPEDSDETYDYAQRLPTVGKEPRAVEELNGGGVSAVGKQEDKLTNILRRLETPGVYTSITPAWNNPNLVRYDDNVLFRKYIPQNGFNEKFVG